MMATIQERFELLSKREKQMVWVTLIAVIFGVADKLFISPALAKKEQLEKEIVNLQAQTLASENEAIQLEALRKQDPNSNNRKQLNALKSQLNSLKQQLNSGDKKFVAANLMASVLRDMLNKHHQLSLVNLETLPVKPITESTQSVFQHGLTITFSGQYFDIHRYLKAIESLPWRFYWDRIDYQVKEYPLAEVTLQVYTLSFQEDWLGI